MSVKFERVITRFIPENDPPTGMIDIGIGAKSEWQTLPAQYPNMKLLGFEPNPKTYLGLLTRFPGLLIPYAVSDVEGSATLVVPENSPAERAAVYGDDKAQREPEVSRHEVPAVTLDSVLGRHGLGAFGLGYRLLLWADIEGYELKALRGASQLLASGAVRWINLEARHVRLRSDCCTATELEEFLSGFGYKKQLEYNAHPPERGGHFDVIYTL